MDRKSAIWLTLLLVFQVHWQSALADETRVGQAKFRLFDALLFSGKPNLKALGFEQLEVTGSAFWVGGRPGKEPDEKAVRAYARSLLERGVQLGRSTLDFLRVHSFFVPKPPSGLVIQRDIAPKQ